MHFVISKEQAGQRLDILSSCLSGLTRSKIQRLISEGQLRINNMTTKQNYKPKTGDAISIEVVDMETALIPEDLSVKILYKDEYLIVLDKPAGMVVYPAAGHARGTVMNAVAYHCPTLASAGAPLRPGVVHRLDKDTSGVMVIALNDEAYHHLVRQFHERTISRRYAAIVYGDIKEKSGTITLSIGRSSTDRKKMSTNTGRGKEALTTWTVRERFGSATLIEAKLGTGRTHQIRVHMAALGHPVLGDRTYGRKTSIVSGRKSIIFHRQMLHAFTLGFIHPGKREYIEFTSPLPVDMADAVRLLQGV